MSVSIQRIYQNNVAFLCVAFGGLLVVIFTLASFTEHRRSGSAVLTAQARMVALTLGEYDSLASASMQNALLPTSSNPSLVLACVFDANHGVRGSRNGLAYDKDQVAKLTCGTARNKDGLSDLLSASAPIVQSRFADPMGEVVLFARRPEISNDIFLWVPISILLALILSLLGWLLGMRFRRILLKPMRQISSTAQRVSLYKDYTLRVVPGPLDIVPEEVQALTESFNAMLKEIEDRDSRLSRKSAELETSREAAEAANRAKSQFLANVSHELRTPLNAIIGFSTMLSDEQFGPLGNPKYVEYARDIQDSGKHLLDVINDILDLTKAEAGKLSVTFSSLNLPKIIEKSMRIVAGNAHQRKVDIYTDFPDKMPKIIADPVRLVQILLNLLSNAVKFSKEGGKVFVRAMAEEARQGIYYFTITVEDQGIGMSDEIIRKVYSSFNQADAGLNRKYEGAGLGLPLTKRLVELHHGKIKIESNVGEGTIVTVRLTSDPALLD